MPGTTQGWPETSFGCVRACRGRRSPQAAGGSLDTRSKHELEPPRLDLRCGKSPPIMATSSPQDRAARPRQSRMRQSRKRFSREITIRELRRRTRGKLRCCSERCTEDPYTGPVRRRRPAADRRAGRPDRRSPGSAASPCGAAPTRSPVDRRRDDPHHFFTAIRHLVRAVRGAGSRRERGHDRLVVGSGAVGVPAGCRSPVWRSRRLELGTATISTVSGEASSYPHGGGTP